MQKLFKEYAKLQEKLATLEEERDNLRAEIIKEMRDDKLEKAETDYGIFTRAIRTTYHYTDAVKKLEEKVKVAKQREVNTGKAEGHVAEYLRFSK